MSAHINESISSDSLPQTPPASPTLETSDVQNASNPSKEIQPHEILITAARIGRTLLEHGAEIYRVENSVTYILEAYGYTREQIAVFAIPTTLIVTLTPPEGPPITQTIRIASRTTHLYKVEQLNGLSRYICREHPSIEEIQKRLGEIIAHKLYNLPAQTLAYAFGAQLFGMFFGGNIWDGLISFCLGALIRLILALLSKIGAGSFFGNIICSAVITILAVLITTFSPWPQISLNADKIIIGALMTLVPGMLLTNCMRDFIAGDVVAGLSRMAEALLIATGIAVGAVFALNIFPR